MEEHKDYLKKQKAIERKPRSGLTKIVIVAGAISIIGLSGCIGYAIGYTDCVKDYNIKSLPNKRENTQNETIFERRARFLNIANKQMLQTQNPEEINGLNSVIKNIENGVYDYSK